MVKVRKPEDPILQSRLRNCLQTILDLRDDLDSSAYSSAFGHELNMIKQFLARAQDVPVTSTDVERIEQATEVFLAELQELLHEKPLSCGHSGSRLQ